MKKSGLLSSFRQPKWRHGKLATVSTLLFIVLCILLGSAIQRLEKQNGWKKDLSFNGYASASEETTAVLQSLNQNIEIYSIFQGSEENRQIIELLQRYQTISNRIHVFSTDLSLNPSILQRFQGNVTQAIEAGTVIVYCPANERYQVLGNNDLYAQSLNLETGSYEWTDLAYEKKLTESILYVSRETLPKIAFLQGHSELTEEEEQQFIAYLSRKSYETVMINLITGDSLKNIDLLVIAAPQKDFYEEELEALGEYAKNGGHFFIMRNYTDPIDSMPNYLSFLRNYGVIPISGIVSESEVDKGSYYGNVYRLLPYMQEMDMTLSLIANQTDVLLMDYACAFEEPVTTDTSLAVGAVLKTGRNAFVNTVEPESNTLEKKNDSQQGNLVLAMYCHRMHANGNISQLYINGNSSMFTDEFIYQRTYIDTYLDAILDQLLGGRSSSLNISTSPAYRQELAINTSAVTLPILFALPVLIFAIGLLVLIPRKNR